jgi:hypothetical protein
VGDVAKWGVFLACDTDRVIEKHVLPVDEEGHALHVPSRNCQCKPRQDVEEPRLWIHNDPEKGGYDA